MVNFGERLLSLRRNGWPYVDYDNLKLLIDAIDEDEATVSAKFLASLSGDLQKIDDFVQKKIDSLSGSFSPTASESTLLKLRAELTTIRDYVGTNVIATTKIVKKHDKHVEPSMRKREAVSTLVCNAAALCSLPVFHQKLERALASHSITLSNANSVTINVVSKDEDEEGEQGLRSLPHWLLQGAEQPTAFFSTYLEDWTLDAPSSDEGGPLLEGSPSAVDEAADDKVWNVDFSDDSTPFWELSHLDKLKVSVVLLLKLSVIVFMLYAFICSLSFMADGFRLVAGKQAGDIFRNSEIFNNSVAGMLVGVLVTVLVQSSSTSTSIVITMVAAELLTVKQAIPLIMGANIGTSVTSTIVAMGQIGQIDEFQRAFAAATVHDMFNFLCVLVLLPTEAATGLLFRISEALIDASPGLESGEKPPDFLKKLTKPFKQEVISVDKKLISKIAAAETEAERAELSGRPMLKYLFDWGPDDISDGAAGALVLTASLLVLCISLFVIVWTLKSILKGRIAVWLHASVNGDIPDLKLGRCTVPLGWITGYLAMAVGVGVTILVQSSSITTSALTPLVGVGVIKLERMYPTVLGANIGTCVTGVLAAFAASSSKLYLTLQVAYAHLLFNLIGITLFYVIWPLRVLPISAARFMGRTTAKYRWFALTYLLFAFFLIPLVFMGLSLWGTVPLVTVIVLVVCVAAFVVVVNTLQTHRLHMLPAALRTWDFLPLPLRSLEPLDRAVCGPLGGFASRFCCCCKTSPQTQATETATAKSQPTTYKKENGASEGSDINTSSTVSSVPSELEVAADRLR